MSQSNGPKLIVHGFPIESYIRLNLAVLNLRYCYIIDEVSQKAVKTCSHEQTEA